nr:EOG090X08JU [Leptodora kindtii]
MQQQRRYAPSEPEEHPHHLSGGHRDSGSYQSADNRSLSLLNMHSMENLSVASLHNAAAVAAAAAAAAAGFTSSGLAGMGGIDLSGLANLNCGGMMSGSQSAAAAAAAAAANNLRKQREFIPDNKKDDSYWDRRRRNNEAAKRSREKRRLNDMVLEQRVMELTKENHILRAQLNAIRDKYGVSGDNLISIDQVLSTLPGVDQMLAVPRPRSRIVSGMASLGSVGSGAGVQQRQSVLMSNQHQRQRSPAAPASNGDGQQQQQQQRFFRQASYHQDDYHSAGVVFYDLCSPSSSSSNPCCNSGDENSRGSPIDVPAAGACLLPHKLRHKIHLGDRDAQAAAALLTLNEIKHEPELEMDSENNNEVDSEESNGRSAGSSNGERDSFSSIGGGGGGGGVAPFSVDDGDGLGNFSEGDELRCQVARLASEVRTLKSLLTCPRCGRYATPSCVAKQKTIAARYILHVVVAVRAFFLFTAVCPLKMVKRKRNSSVVAEKQVAAEVVDEEVPLIRVSDEPVVKKLKGKWTNKERVLIFSARGITQRDRHLMTDLREMMPHSKPESKMEKKDPVFVINEIAEMKNCNKCIYFEGRKKQDLYMWMSNIPKGPCAKFYIENIHTMKELKMTGNCLKGTRPFLSFDSAFDTKAHWMLLKELFIQTFSTPKNHPKSQPFFDHIFTFTIIENRVWFRNFQIIEEDGQMAEIGPRFVLNPIKIFNGSFGGETLWENPNYVTPNALTYLL